MQKAINTIALMLAAVSVSAQNTDSQLVGAEAYGAWVPATNLFLKGENRLAQPTSAAASLSVRYGISARCMSRYKDLYPQAVQGVGLGATAFDSGRLLGTPLSAFVFQTAPIARFGKFAASYEWEFGAACGWRNYRMDETYMNWSVSTPVTAHMGLSFKASYPVGKDTEVYLGLKGMHFSNGNTSWPNGGVNTLGISLGATYSPSQPSPSVPDAQSVREANRPKWIVDIVPYAWWRRRTIAVVKPQVCPGRFAVAGIQTSLLRRFNRFWAVGATLDTQWDESANLPDNLAGGSGPDIKFYRPDALSQISCGISAHGQLTMAMFTLDAGIGVNIVRPDSEPRYYQSLALKTFVTDHIYLNTGYRLGNFSTPQNLVTGIGFRF